MHHTVVQWDHYRRKEGVVQCTRCQRPDHSARNCNMPARCCLCGDGHDTLKCLRTEKKLQSALIDEGDAKTIEVPIPAKCCNGNVVGHFASDPKCPKKMAYAQARRQRTSERWPVKKMDNPLPPSHRYTPGGPSYANIAGPDLRSFGPSGNFN